MHPMNIFILRYYNGNRRAQKAVSFAQAVFNKADVGKMQIFLGADFHFKDRRIGLGLPKVADARMAHALAFARPVLFHDAGKKVR